MKRFLSLCFSLLCLALAPLSAAQTPPDSPELDAAVTAAITHFNRQIGTLIQYREAGRISDGEGAVIFVEVLNRATGDAYPGVIDWLYGLRSGDTWTITLQGDAGYRAAYRQLADALTAQFDAADRQYRTQAVPGRVPPAQLLNYELPFPDTTYGTITRSYSQHGTGKVDFDLTGTEISASKDGEIVFASDGQRLQTYQSGAWWYWNTVIIRHGDYEYSLYGHILPDSIPAWIRAACPIGQPTPCSVPVRAGEVIALEGNTGNSTNPHLHVEFGQGYGVVPYLDVLDDDGDGRRDEVIYAGYVYGEHNVGLNGVLPEAVAAWGYLTVLQSVLGG